MTDSTLTHAAHGFAAMGSESRLGVLRTLVRAGDDGLTVGEIGERMAIPASTLAHHLKYLSTAGLIEQVKDGRSVINRAAYGQLQVLAGYILEECCADASAGEKNTKQRTLA